MSERPILFNTEMVKAILDGRKTQTRRLCKGQPQDGITSPEEMGYTAPYKPGDVLWVRETWQYIPESDTDGFYVYAADRENPADWKWRPSIHMPRAAARLFLRVTGVRMERLQDMSEDDAIAEGYRGCDAKHPVIYYPDCTAEPCWVTGYECIYEYWYCNHTLQEGFGRDIWDSTIKKADLPCYGWEANPWVWVIEFERLDDRPAGRWADRDTAQYGNQDVLMPAT